MRLFALFLMLAPAAAVASGGGSSGAEFLRIGMGARPAALGESFTGLADDVTAAAWNPAGLGRLTRIELSAMHMMYMQDMTYEFLAGSFPVGRAGVLAFSGAYLNVPPFDSTEPNSGLPKGTAADGVGSLSWGMNLGPLMPSDPDYEHLYVGVTGKFIYRSLGGYAPSGGVGETYTAMSGAADIGFLYEWTPAVTVGASMMNLGAPITFLGDEADALPLSIRVGAGWRAMDQKWMAITVLADVVKPVDADGGAFESGTWGGGGLEVVIDRTLSLRGGFRQAADGARVVGGAGVTFSGIGVDYAFLPMETLGTVHRLGLTVKLGTGYLQLPAPKDPVGEALPGGKALVRWAPVKGAAGYLVDLKKPGAEEFKRVTPRPRAAPELTLGGLAPGNEYDFHIMAVDGAGHEGKPALAKVLIPVPTVKAPATFKAVALGGGKVSLSWTAVPEASGYLVFERRAGVLKTLTTKPLRATKAGLKGVKAGIREYAIASVGPDGKQGKAMKLARVTVR